MGLENRSDEPEGVHHGEAFLAAGFDGVQVAKDLTQGKMNVIEGPCPSQRDLLLTKVKMKTEATASNPVPLNLILNVARESLKKNPCAKQCKLAHMLWILTFPRVFPLSLHSS